MALPKFLQPYLASYHLSDLDLKTDKKIIITQILNLGDTKAVKWLLAHYEIPEIKEVVEKPKRGMWIRLSLSYWQKIFDIRIREDIFELAIINLNPNPKLYEKPFDQDVSS